MLFLVSTSKLIRKKITVFLENHNFHKYHAVVTVFEDHILDKMVSESRPVKVNFLHGILYCKFVSIYVTVFGTWFGALYHNDHISFFTTVTSIPI